MIENQASEQNMVFNELIFCSFLKPILFFPIFGANQFRFSFREIARVVSLRKPFGRITWAPGVTFSRFFSNPRWCVRGLSFKTWRSSSVALRLLASPQASPSPWCSNLSTLTVVTKSRSFSNDCCLKIKKVLLTTFLVSLFPVIMAEIVVNIFLIAASMLLYNDATERRKNYLELWLILVVKNFSFPLTVLCSDYSWLVMMLS